MGKDDKYDLTRFRPPMTRNVADPLSGTRGRPRFIAQGIIFVPERFERFPVTPGMTEKRSREGDFPTALEMTRGRARE